MPCNHGAPTILTKSVEKQIMPNTKREMKPRPVLAKSLKAICAARKSPWCSRHYSQIA